VVKGGSGGPCVAGNIGRAAGSADGGAAGVHSRCGSTFALAARVAIKRRWRSQPADPDLVLCQALTIVSTLIVYVVGSRVGAFSVAPLLAMLRNQGADASLAAAMRLGPLKSKQAG